VVARGAHAPGSHRPEPGNLPTRVWPRARLRGYTSGQPFNAPSITLDEARLSSGEAFINGQHDPTSRPKPIARAYVDVTPAAQPQMDFLATFDEGTPWGPFTDFAGSPKNQPWSPARAFFRASTG